VVGEGQLEGRNPGQRAGWSADLGGEVRQGQQVIAEPGGFRREAVSGELHAVAGITGKPNYDPIKLDDLFGHRITFASMSQLCHIVPCFPLAAYRNGPA